MSTRTVYGGPERYAFVPDVAERLVGDISDKTADFFGRSVGFEQLAMPDEAYQEFVINPNVIRAYHKVVEPYTPHIQKLAGQIDRHEKNKPGAGRAWAKDMEEKTLAEGILATIHHDVSTQPITRELVQQARMLPVSDRLMSRVQSRWFDTLVARQQSPIANPAVTERVAIVYANLCTETPTIHPDSRKLRTIPDPRQTSRVIPVQRELAKNLDKLAKEVSEGKHPKLTLEDVIALGRMAYEDYALPWDRDGKPAMEHANDSSNLGRIGRRATAVSVFGVGAGMVFAPHAAAATPATPNVSASVGTSLHFAPAEATATSPSSLPGSRPGLIINVTQRAAAATRLQTAPTVPATPSIVSAAAAPKIQVVQTETKAAHTLVTPVQETVQATVAPQEVKPTVPVPAPVEPQKEHSVLADAAKDGVVTPEERVQAEVATLGLGANVDTPAPTAASESDKAAPETTKPLFEKSLLLSEYLEPKVTEIVDNTTNGRTSGLVENTTASTAILQLQALLKDSSYFKNLSDDQKQAIQAPGSGMNQSIIAWRAKELEQELSEPQNGGAKDIDKKDLPRIAMQLAIAELSVAPQEDIDRIQMAVEDAAEKARQKAAAEKARQEAEARKAAAAYKSEKLSTSTIESRALDRMQKSSDKSIAKAATYAEKLISRGMKRDIAFGFIADIRDETGKPLMDCSTEQYLGPAKGCIQWEGGRLDNLYKFAHDKGKSWKDADVQFDFIMHELEGSERAAWDRIKQANSPEEAATLVLSLYERAADSSPGGQNDHDRRNYATQFSKAYDKEKDHVIADAKRRAAAKARAEAEVRRKMLEAKANYPELWDGLNFESLKKVNDVLDHKKHEKSQLKEYYSSPEQGRLQKAGYLNGRLSGKILKDVDGTNRHPMYIGAAKAFIAMNEEYHKDTGDRLSILGGSGAAYRSLQIQQEIKASNPGSSSAQVAIPGTSNHGWGLAVDLDNISYGSSKYEWLVKNAYKYGWFHSYEHDPGNPNAAQEPWHWNWYGIGPGK